MDIFVVRREVIDDIILHRPRKEVELTDSGGNSMEVDTGPTTEGIKHLLAIRFEMGLVCEVDNHMLSGLGDVGHVVHLGVIGHKPVKDPEGDVGLVVEDVAEESEAFWSVE
jgi:hypothetical protein